MKVALLCLSLAAVCLASCTTIQNRRDMYCGYGHVNGPYTSDKYLEKPKAPSVSDGKEVVK